jgi:hypothetical protein
VLLGRVAEEGPFVGILFVLWCLPLGRIDLEWSRPDALEDNWFRLSFLLLNLLQKSLGDTTLVGLPPLLAEFSFSFSFSFFLVQKHLLAVLLHELAHDFLSACHEGLVLGNLGLFLESFRLEAGQELWIIF